MKRDKTKSERKKAKIQFEIDGLSKTINELGNILCEISSLEASTNVYDVKMGAMTDKNGKTQMNKSNGHIEILVGDESALAHELVHAYQGLTGECSFNADGDPKHNAGFLYDIYDEIQAYKRSMFYSVLFESDNDDESFKNRFMKATGGSDVINIKNLYAWSEKQKGNLANLPVIQLNTQSKVNETAASEFTKKHFGNLTYDEWQQFIRKNDKYDTYPTSKEHYFENSFISY